MSGVPLVLPWQGTPKSISGIGPNTSRPITCVKSAKLCSTRRLALAIRNWHSTSGRTIRGGPRPAPRERPICACCETITPPAPRPSAARRFRYRYVRRQWWLVFSLIDLIGWTLSKIARLLTGSKSAPCGHSSAAVDSARATRSLGRRDSHHRIARRFASPLSAAQIEVLAAPGIAMFLPPAAEVQRVFICRNNRFAPNVDWRWPLAHCILGLATAAATL